MIYETSVGGELEVARAAPKTSERLRKSSGETVVKLAHNNNYNPDINVWRDPSLTAFRARSPLLELNGTGKEGSKYGKHGRLQQRGEQSGDDRLTAAGAMFLRWGKKGRDSSMKHLLRHLPRHPRVLQCLRPPEACVCLCVTTFFLLYLVDIVLTRTTVCF